MPIDDESAMRWALTTGNSTKTDSIDLDVPRGLGFRLLSEFVTVNRGELSIYSNTCEAKAIGIGEYSVSAMKTSFNGTLVNISINCDGRAYYMLDRPPTNRYF